MMKSLALAFGSIAVLAAGSVPARAAAPAPVNLTQLDHISVLQLGERGTPVILIPGLASPRAVWDGIVPRLAASHRVYLVQVNGFGGDAPRGNAQGPVLPAVVADLHGFIVRQKLQGAAVIGHSLGGTLGLLLAKREPGDIGRLMVVDMLPYLSDIVLPNVPAAQVATIAGGLRARFVQAPTMPDYAMQTQATAEMYGLKPDSRAKIVAWTKAADPAVSGQAFGELLTTDLRPDLASIATPITLVYPWADPAMPKARADTAYRRWYASAPHITYVPVGQSRHFVMLDQPEAFGTAVDAFLAG